MIICYTKQSSIDSCRADESNLENNCTNDKINNSSLQICENLENWKYGCIHVTDIAECIDAQELNKLQQEYNTNINNQNNILTKECEFGQICYKDYDKSFKSLCFLNYFMSQGKSILFFENVEIKFYSDSNRSLITKSKIPKNQLLVRIPYSKLLTLKQASKSKLVQEVIPLKISIDEYDSLSLAIFLLEESKKSDSKWKFYLDTFPKNLNNFPIFYNENELELLKGSDLYTLIKNEYNEYKSEYQEIVNKTSATSVLGNDFFNDFLKMNVLVNSRRFLYTYKGKESSALAPFADMINHSRPPNARYYFDSKKRVLEITARKNLEKNEEIFITYGNERNDSLFSYYGFFIEKNASILISVDLKEVKNNIEYDNDIETIEFKLTYSLDDSDFKNLFSFLRFMMMNQVKIIDKKLVNNIFYEISAISITNEKSVLSYLLNKINNLIIKYPESKEFDIELLRSDTTLSENERNCVIYRLEEKKLLDFYQKFFEGSLHLLKSNNVEEAKIRLKTIEELNNDYYKSFESYFEDTVFFLLEINK